MVALDTELAAVLGGKAAAALRKGIDVGTVGDLLAHYPRRYAERGEMTDLSQLREGDDVTVTATVKSVRGKRLPGGGRRGRHILEAVVTDGTGTLTLTFFNQQWRERDFVVGAQGLFAGQVKRFRDIRQLNNPDYLFFTGGGSNADIDVSDFTAGMMPVYPATGTLRTWTIARCVKLVLDALDPQPDPLPSALRAEHHLMGLDAAVRAIHRPQDRAELARARQRLKWDEALTVQLVLAQRRIAAAGHPARARVPRPDAVGAAFDAALPFELTAGQREVGDVIAAELAREHPMQRLLQGEVGSGKTIVALRAMLQVVDAGGQAALLAPTEVLAAQHLRSIETMLGPLGQGGLLGGADKATRVTLLLGTGSQSAAVRKQALLEAASGQAGIVVGTHALIQDTVAFADLGLVVVDEQHRFGVEQRDALRAKAAVPPHVLVMTATPIPRTVAMTVFGDLETSTLRELPRGRAPIATSVVPVAEKPAWLERGWQRIREEVAAGRQAYVVCPSIGEAPNLSSGGPGAADAIDPAEAMERWYAAGGEDEPPGFDGEDGLAGTDERRKLAGVLETAELLAAGPLSGLRIAVLHGRLPSEQKDDVMSRFGAGEIDVLVATTVVEVGVDVPNATVMAVLDADRFGVSQLHQLRGRIGRGGHPGLCLLVTALPPATPARERLDAIAETTDGFELARLDLEQRREGDVLGAAQSGRTSGLRLLSLVRDEELIARCRVAATQLVEADAQLAAHPLLAAQVQRLVADERAEYLDKS